jgi:hypothetical protein
MNQWDAQSAHLAELATLPSSNPARAELEGQISLMDSSRQDRWRNILRETDALYFELAQVQIPAGLEEQLLLVPGERSAKRQKFERFLGEPIGWKQLAACALIALGILAFVFWPKSVPPELRLLDPALADKIAGLVIQHRQAQASMEISSDNAGKVQAALAARKPPVTVAVAAPRANFVLRGGGTCDFGSTRAVYTSWQANGFSCTLFQFDAKDLGVPPLFQTTVATPKSPPPGSAQYHVVIWPGRDGEGTWALLLESDGALAGFMHGGGCN